MSTNEVKVNVLKYKLEAVRYQILEMIASMCKLYKGTIYFRNELDEDGFIGIEIKENIVSNVIFNDDGIKSLVPMSKCRYEDLIRIAERLSKDDINMFTKLLDVDGVRTRIKNHKHVCLMSNYSINIQLGNDAEKVQDDWDQFEKLIDAQMEVNSYNDLVVDTRNDDDHE